MRVALWKMEPYQNIAQDKIYMYHTTIRRDAAEDYLPVMAKTYDIIYISSLFDFTSKELIGDWRKDCQIICGGTGYDDYETEPYKITRLPAEIEAMRPRKNRGFTCRGCNRKCPFCVVWKKEGCFNVVGDVFDIWDGTTKDITLYDNNILLDPEHFLRICRQVQKYNLRVDFNQGLDIRLLNRDIVEIMSETSHREYRFAFDNIKTEAEVRNGIRLMQSYNINRAQFYVLVGYDTTKAEDLYRLNVLRDFGMRAFVMPYQRKITKDMPIEEVQKIKQREMELRPIATWANKYYMHMPFKEFMLNFPRNKSYLKYYQEFIK